MGGTEKFCLRWNDFESNISVAFRELREDKDFFDVTLACDDEQIQAHKVILSACSPFFRTILRRNPHAHPLLYLKGVKFTDLQSVLNFMYHGEVNVAQEELNSFLAIAEELRVKGLTQNNGSSNSQNQQSAASKPSPQLPKSLPLPKPSPRPSPQMDPVPPPKRPRPPAAAAEEDDDIQEVVVPVKAEPQPYQAETSHALAPHEEALVQYGEEGYEDYGQYEGEEGAYDTSMVGMDGNKGQLEDPEGYAARLDKKIESLTGQTESGELQCLVCGKLVQVRQNMRNHIETHVGEVVACELCGKQFKTRNSLNVHRSTKHKPPTPIVNHHQAGQLAGQQYGFNPQ